MKTISVFSLSLLFVASCEIPPRPILNSPSEQLTPPTHFLNPQAILSKKDVQLEPRDQDQYFSIQAIPATAVTVVMRTTGGALTSPVIKLLMLNSNGFANGFLDTNYHYQTIAFKLPTGTGYLVQAEARNQNGVALARGQVNINVTAAGISQSTLILFPIPTNSPPQIQALNALPSSLPGSGHTARLTCAASDPENANLTYAWSTLGGNFGSFSAINSAQTYWTSPSPANSNYVMRCSVSDGTHTTTQDYNVAVATGSSDITGSGGLH